jgi:two-component system sensor histidine kinase RstB
MAPVIRALMVEGVEEQLLGGGLRWVAAEFDERPASEWPELLSEARRRLPMSVSIVAAETLTPTAARRASTARPFLARHATAQGPPSMFFPLHAGSSFLVAGPMPPPPVGPFIAGALVFGLVITAAASAIVGLPLARRLRRLRQAVHELGRGNWSVRLDADTEGALRELAESINRTAIQLQRLFQEREALLQAVSHEIGTPLSRMRFHVEALENAVAGHESRSRLRALSEDLDELDELGTELVGWMASDSGAQFRQPFEVKPVLESLVELACDGRAQMPTITLMAPDGLQVCADQRQFQRAIENLLRNALRYAQQRVTVDVTSDASHVVIDVRDDGPGIPPDERARVLEPFVRLEGPRSQTQRGLGLGLAIVRRIVEAHGGIVTIGGAGDEGGTHVRTSWPVR